MGLRAVSAQSLTNATLVNPTITGAATVTASGLTTVLARSTVQVGVASSGSIGNNGALTGHTAFPRTISEGLYLYFPANAIAAGIPAGFYWVKMSSTTAGTIYNSTYTAGTPVVGTDTPFVTTGPGAYTGVVTEQGATITIPAAAAGTVYRVTTLWEGNGVANAHTLRVRLGGAAGTAYLSQNLAQQSSLYDQRMIWVVGTSRQIGQTGAAPATNASAGVAPVTSTVDMTASTTMVFTVEHTTATDWATLSGLLIEIIYP
jgi:hypothetical protein